VDRLDELTIFLAIFEAGSLVVAARRLRRSPPAVTRALRALEDRLGLRLFERTTRRLAPTEAARLLAERARALLSEYERTLVGASEAPVRGLLRITAPVQFGRRHVAPVVSAFLSDYPDIRIELTLNDRNLDLIEEGLDLAVRIGGLPDSTLIARQVGSVRRVVVASPGYIAARGLPRAPLDLAMHDTIFGLARSSAREWRFGQKGRGPVIRLSPRLLVDDVEAQVQAAKGGRGVARVLSYQVEEELAAGSLVRLLRDFEPEPLPVQLVTLSRDHMTSKVRAFIDMSVKVLRQAEFGAGRFRRRRPST
jgi:DNA-binding transcriptional LysR family regulator